MSEGPIKAWRDAHKPPKVSTSEKDRVCGGDAFARPYCGRRRAPVAERWADVTCADCHAARRADAEPHA